MARDIEASGLVLQEDEMTETRTKHFSDLPLRSLKRCSPTMVTLLEQIGYDHVLLIQDLTHLCIYLSCFVTFFFSAMWLVDVFTMNCALQRSDAGGDFGGDSIIGTMGSCVPSQKLKPGPLGNIGEL